MYNKLLLFVQANIYFLCNENIILKIFILKITLNDIIINYYYNVVAEVCLTLFHIKGIKKLLDGNISYSVVSSYLGYM